MYMRSSSILEEEKTYLQIMLMNNCDEFEFYRACFICAVEYDRSLLFVEAVEHDVDASVEIIEVEKGTLHLSIEDYVKRRDMFSRRMNNRKVLSLTFPQDNFVFYSVL